MVKPRDKRRWCSASFWKPHLIMRFNKHSTASSPVLLQPPSIPGATESVSPCVKLQTINHSIQSRSRLVFIWIHYFSLCSASCRTHGCLPISKKSDFYKYDFSCVSPLFFSFFFFKIQLPMCTALMNVRRKLDLINTLWSLTDCLPTSLPDTNELFQPWLWKRVNCAFHGSFVLQPLTGPNLLHYTVLGLWRGECMGPFCYFI